MITTLKTAKTIASLLGFTVSKRDGEYRLNLIGGSEDTAYYSNDLTDIRQTMIAWSNDRAVAVANRAAWEAEKRAKLDAAYAREELEASWATYKLWE